MGTIRDLQVLDRPAECCAPIARSGLSERDAETTARVFKALSDPHRIKIVNILATAEEPACVCDLTPALGLSQPTVSFHLKKLVQAGILDREQRGVWAHYSINQGVMDRLSTIFRPEGRTR